MFPFLNWLLFFNLESLLKNIFKFSKFIWISKINAHYLLITTHCSHLIAHSSHLSFLPFQPTNERQQCWNLHEIKILTSSSTLLQCQPQKIPTVMNKDCEGYYYNTTRIGHVKIPNTILVYKGERHSGWGQHLQWLWTLHKVAHCCHIKKAGKKDYICCQYGQEKSCA
jgi:hypothetical protein